MSTSQSQPQSQSEYTNEPLTPDELQEIPHPLLKLTEHVLSKGLQAGSILGNTIGTLMLFRRRPSSVIQGIHQIGHQGVKWSVYMSIGSLVFMDIRLWQEGFNKYRIWDRAYRLKYHESQNRCDTFAAVGGILGFIVMQHPSLRAGSRLYSGACGATLGITEGVLLHALTNPRSSVENEVTSAVKAVETNVQNITTELEKR